MPAMETVADLLILMMQIGALPGTPGKGKNVDLATTNMDQRQFDQPDYWKHTAETSAFRQVWGDGRVWRHIAVLPLGAICKEQCHAKEESLSKQL